MLAVAVFASAATVSVNQLVSAGPAPTASAFVPISPCRLFDTPPTFTCA